MVHEFIQWLQGGSAVSIFVIVKYGIPLIVTLAQLVWCVLNLLYYSFFYAIDKFMFWKNNPFRIAEKYIVEMQERRDELAHSIEMLKKLEEGHKFRLAGVGHDKTPYTN